MVRRSFLGCKYICHRSVGLVWKIYLSICLCVCLWSCFYFFEYARFSIVSAFVCVRQKILLALLSALFTSFTFPLRFFRLVNFPISQYSGLRFIVPANLCALYFYYQHIVVAIVIPFRDVAYHPRNSGVHIVFTYFRFRLIWLRWSCWKLHSCVPSSCHGAKASGPSFPSSNVGNSFLSPQSIFCASPTAIVCRLCCSLVRETGNAKNT